MRFVLAAVVLVGCGSSLDPLPAPLHTERTVVDAGTSNVQPVSKPEPTSTCTLEVYTASSGTAYAIRRELVDARGRPKERINGAVVETFGYDGDRIVSLPPYSFVYEGDLLEVFSKGGPSAIEYHHLDAHDNVLDQISSPGSPAWVTYGYDDAGRLTAQTQEGSSSLAWTYDAQGFLATERSTYSGSTLCQRTWTWDHGAVETVTVGDGTTVTQSCSYTFDSMDRIVSARCRYVTAFWSYTGDTTTMTMSQSGSFTNVERLRGKCDTPTRSNLSRTFEPLPYDPRPSKWQFRRLSATPVPSPYRECGSFVGGPEEGKL